MQGGHNKKIMSNEDYMAKVMREVWGGDEKKVDKEALDKILEALPAPNWIGEYGKQLWNEILPRLVAFEVLKKNDLPIFEALCSNYDLYRRADDEIAAQGLVVQGDRGILKKNPAVEIREKAWKSFLSAAEHFGLTPLARSRLQVIPSEGDDEFGDLID